MVSILRKIRRANVCYTILVFLVCILFLQEKHKNFQLTGRSLKDIYKYDYRHENLVTYDRSVPLIWIGGVPRSGTTLFRAMLDAHPDVRCGEETRVVPRFVAMHEKMSKSHLEMKRLFEAKVTHKLLDDALGAYILTIISGHGEPAPRLCNKDPFTLRSMPRLKDIFPASKFILMVRDGRAVCHSLITRNVTISSFDTKTYKGCLQHWNMAFKTMFEQCMLIGESVCIPVNYEKLVLRPRENMEKILQWLSIRWDESVLHHEKTIGKKGGVSLAE